MTAVAFFVLILISTLAPQSSFAQAAARPAPVSMAPAERTVAPAVGSNSQVVLRPGDAIQITVWRQPELSGEFTLGADGTIDHPLYSSLVMANVPLATAHERLQVFLRDWEEQPYFLLKPLFRVAVGGEVQRPNLYTFAPEMTIAQAVAAAGGVSERGRLAQVQVLRTNGENLVVDLTKYSDITVQSGDQIFVQRSRSAVFRDYVAPAGSLAMAAVTLLGVFLR